MPNVIITPLMSLPNPVPGADPGPDYATNLQSSLNILDGHNHSSGSGAQITPSGILLNADLSFNEFNATLLKSARFSPQSAPLAGASDLACTYVSGVDLWFNDASGNQVRLTSGGVVNATSSGISSGTASAAFSGGVLVVDSNTNTPANIQAGSILIGEPTVSPNFITVQSPTNLAASYPFVLPTALPAAQKFMTLDASGNTAAPWAVDNATLEISGGTTLQIKTLADDSVTTSKIADNAVTPAKLSSPNLQLSSNINGSFSTGDVAASGVTFTASGLRPVNILLQGGYLVLSQVAGPAITSITIQIKKLVGAVQTILSDQLIEVTSPSGASVGISLPASSISYIDSPAAGGILYFLRINTISSGTSLTIASSKLCVYEL